MEGSEEDLQVRAIWILQKDQHKGKGEGGMSYQLKLASERLQGSSVGDFWWLLSTTLPGHILEVTLEPLRPWERFVKLETGFEGLEHVLKLAKYKLQIPGDRLRRRWQEVTSVLVMSISPIKTRASN